VTLTGTAKLDASDTISQVCSDYERVSQSLTSGRSYSVPAGNIGLSQCASLLTSLLISQRKYDTAATAVQGISNVVGSIAPVASTNGEEQDSHPVAYGTGPAVSTQPTQSVGMAKQQEATPVGQIGKLQNQEDSLATIGRVSAAAVADAQQAATVALEKGESACLELPRLDGLTALHQLQKLEVYLEKRQRNSVTLDLSYSDTCSPLLFGHGPGPGGSATVQLVIGEPVSLFTQTGINVPYYVSYSVDERHWYSPWKVKSILRFQPDLSAVFATKWNPPTPNLQMIYAGGDAMGGSR
jgi:hypothetical protein